MVAGPTGQPCLSKPSQSYLTKGEMWMSQESANTLIVEGSRVNKKYC